MSDFERYVRAFLVNGGIRTSMSAFGGNYNVGSSFLLLLLLLFHNLLCLMGSSHAICNGDYFRGGGGKKLGNVEGNGYRYHLEYYLGREFKSREFSLQFYIQPKLYYCKTLIRKNGKAQIVLFHVIVM
jgi:hypothetical protein